jgi:hypothetical protein
MFRFPPFPFAMQKDAVLAALRSELESQYRRLAGAAGEARGYATDPDSKAENKYDTRTVEASYLAAGQAAKAEELAATLQFFSTWMPTNFEGGDPIDLGALVAVAFPGGDGAAYLLAPRGGGLDSTVQGITVTVVTPQAPIFQKLLGKRAGEWLTGQEFSILSVS